MINKEIKIKLPDYIESIFQNSSIDGKIDYLKSTFDDRNININAFYILNFEVYKGLLLDENYDDKDFLKIKRNLFYCSNAKLIIEEIDFSFSKYYNTENFIEKELNQFGTEFDKFCALIFKEDSKGVIKYLKKTDGINKKLKNKIVNNKLNRSFLLRNFINKDDLFDLIKNICSKDEVIKNLNNNNFNSYSSIIIYLSSNEGLKHLSNLNLEIEVVGAIIESSNMGRPNLLDEILGLENSDKVIEFLNINDKLIEGFEKPNEYSFMLTHLLYTEKTIEYLKTLGLTDLLLKTGNSNFDWLVEKISNSDYGKEYLIGLKNTKINKIFESEKNKIDIKKVNNSDITEKELEQINKGKIKVEDKLHQILRSELGIRFLEDNYDNKEISKYLVKTPRLFTSISNTEHGVKYLRKLKIDDIVTNQVKIESKKGQVYALLAHLLMNDEGIRYLKDLNKNDVLKGNLLEERLILSKTQFNNLYKYKDLYIKENLISALQGKHPIAEGIDSVFHRLSYTQEGIKIIIEANIKDIVRKSILETKDYHYMYTLRFFNDSEEGKQYLKDILNLETDDIKNQVYNFIKTSDSGSCLLSGYRGTGKTSLLKSVVRKVQDETKNLEEVIQVIVNIPEQKKDENGDKKSFNKNELLTKIIREVYYSLEKIGIKGDEIKDFEEQYIRTFNNIDNIQKDEKSNTLKLDFSIKDFLIFVITTILIICGWNIEMIKDNNVLQLILVILGFIGLKTSLGFIHKKSNSTIIKNLYTDDIAEFKLTENIKKITNGKSKKRKFVIIIDELDKLLDLEVENSGNTASIKDIFDVLGKLKTLFFDNTGAIFFVVTNKDAYNYYLENKHSEDDLISNIFNKVLYLPMIRKENFNINRTFKIEGIEKNSNEDGIQNDYFNNWIYYKSHGNWRKANFILNQKLNNKTIKLDKDNLDYDMKFYDFMNILYYLFTDKNYEIDKQKFDNNFIPGKDFYEFIDKFILELMYNDSMGYSKDNYQGIVKKTMIGLLRIKVNKINITLIEGKIKKLTEKYTNSKPFDTFAYIHSSVDKISNQPAYKDFIINSILNILEILKHDRNLRLEDILVKLKFTEIDINYPAFEDLILVYIPFMIYYFDNLKENEN